MTESRPEIQNELTRRECEVLRTFAKSATGKQAAHELDLKLQTMKNNLYMINQRLGTENARQAIWQHFVLNRGATYCYIDHRDSTGQYSQASGEGV